MSKSCKKLRDFFVFGPPKVVKPVRIKGFALTLVYDHCFKED